MYLRINQPKRIIFIICLLTCLLTVYLVYAWKNVHPRTQTDCRNRLLKENIFLSRRQVNEYENWLNSKLPSARMNQRSCDYKVPDLWNLKANITGILPRPQQLCPMEVCKKNKTEFDEYAIWKHLLHLGINITPGGEYRPPTTYGPYGMQRFPCHAEEHLAILVPYRERLENLALFLNYMHTFLPLQRRSYRIYLLEQVPGKRFNRAKLFNAGLSALGLRETSDTTLHAHFDCFAFHDIDKVPSNLNLIYSCIDGGFQLMDTSIFEERMARNHKEYFGGATLLDRWSVQRINGLSNSFEGWGGEDDDLRFRLQLTNHNIVKPNHVSQVHNVGGFYILKHHDDMDRNEFAKYRLHCDSVFTRMQAEGLSNVDYKVVSIRIGTLFTHLVLEI